MIEKENKNKEETINSNNTANGKFTKIFAIIGIIAIILLGGWIAITGVQRIPPALSSAAVTISSVFNPGERMVLSTRNPNIASGEEVTLNWRLEGRGLENGSYALSYPCLEGVSLQLRGDTVTCGDLYSFDSDNSEVRITAVSEENRFVDVPVTVHFIKDGQTEISTSDDVLLTVTNLEVVDSRSIISSRNEEIVEPDPIDIDDETPSQEQPQTPPATTPTPPSPQPQTPPQPVTQPIVPGPGVSDPQGLPDLAIRLLAVGVVDRTTGVFTAKATIDPNERAAIRFEVINQGTRESGQWRFHATLPTSPQTHLYVSDFEVSLMPQDRIEYTLGFDNIQRVAQSSISVHVDPQNLVQESSTANNTMTAVINVEI